MTTRTKEFAPWLHLACSHFLTVYIHNVSSRCFLFLSPHTHTQVGNAKKCTAASMLLMEKHRIYVQDINYPTVARGKEKLRIAPTPFHTPEMQEKFVASVVDVWQELGLDLLEPNLKECRGHAPMHGFLGNVQLAA